MKRKEPAVSGLLVLTALLGCEPRQELDPEQAAEARRTIVTWLECEECEAGELEAVVDLGETAVPTLIATLQGGPSPASRESLRLHLVDTYNRLQEYGQTHPEARLDMTEDEYVQMYMDNYVALYQVRSANALAAIGGAEAQRALQELQNAELRDDVRAAVSQAVQTVGPP